MLDLYDKQALIWKEKRPEIRNLLFIGGIQCGKTTVGGLWSTRESFMYKPVDGKLSEDTGIIAAPTYKILQQATLPKFLSLNYNCGTYNKVENVFRYDWGFTVYMRTATKPESMEGISNCRWVWLDEGGLCPRYFYENCMGRVARLQGRILATSTPYAMNWMAEIAEGQIKGKRDDTLLVQVRSIDSPYFPKAEYDRQEKLLDPRRFQMKYMGQFGKMQGLVYPDIPLCRSKPLPPGTKYYAGIDWGHTDPFVITIRAVTPPEHGSIHYRVDEYYKVGMIASDMFDVVRSKYALYNFERVWADPSRPEYILELSNLGIPIYPGTNDIRLGIDKQTELMRLHRWFMFEDMCPNGKDEYETYHYPEPKELSFDQAQKEQNPVDASNHGCDADRYCTMGILEDVGPAEKLVPRVAGLSGQLSTDQRTRIEQLKKRRDARQY